MVWGLVLPLQPPSLLRGQGWPHAGLFPPACAHRVRGRESELVDVKERLGVKGLASYYHRRNTPDGRKGVTRINTVQVAVT